jgi:hypothetical protein
MEGHALGDLKAKQRNHVLVAMEEFTDLRDEPLVVQRCAANIDRYEEGTRKPQAFAVDPIFEERFRTIKRVFAWEDKFRRLLLRFERLIPVHYTFKTLAYTMINLRHYC